MVLSFNQIVRFLDPRYNDETGRKLRLLEDDGVRVLGFELGVLSLLVMIELMNDRMSE
jgi:hypothetical protein